jgi:hypothetical protein
MVYCSLEAMERLDHVANCTITTSLAPDRFVNSSVTAITRTATTSKALDWLTNGPVHAITQTATTSKALGRLADHAVRDILAHVRSLG